MEQVDFSFVGLGGGTIYTDCFNKYLGARYAMQKSEAEWSKIIPQVETIFDFLTTEGNKNGFNVDSILEIPDSCGGTCFSVASCCSEKICNYIIDRGVKVNSITATMGTPSLTYPDVALRMMQRGLNPHVIDYTEKSRVDEFPSSFQSDESKRLLATFPRSFHYTTEDVVCNDSCPADCTAKFEKFYYRNGKLVEMTEKNRIGSGGFGMVFRELFHGIPMAMKCMPMGKIEPRSLVNEQVSDLEKNISELRIQIATMGSGVIVPVAFVRQQNQEQDQYGNWIAKNYNIYIYPLYDCNLYELHGNHFDQFTEEIVGDIVNQCFIRIGSWNFK